METGPGIIIGLCLCAVVTKTLPVGFFARQDGNQVRWSRPVFIEPLLELWLEACCIAANPPGFPGNLPDFETCPGIPDVNKKSRILKFVQKKKKQQHWDHFFDFVRDFCFLSLGPLTMWQRFAVTPCSEQLVPTHNVSLRIREDLKSSQVQSNHIRG